MKKQLENLLDQVWRAGDRDEMSIKHIGHGLAALITYDDWTKGDDYTMPDYLDNAEAMTALRNKITAIWQQVKEMKDAMGTEDFTELVSQTKFSFYPMQYLETKWLSYAKHRGERNV